VNVLGVIPARGGSKAIPRKNVVPLAGRPLIAWTIEAALGSRTLSHVVVSTDDAEIAGVARALGAEVPFLRPAALATDDAGALEVIRHAIGEAEALWKARIDAVAYLQPTSPLRTARHIDAAVELFRSRGADSVVTVTAVPHNMSLESQLAMHADGALQPAMAGARDTLRRQTKVRRYARNGPAVLVVSRRCVMEAGALYGERTFGLEMPAIESLDVDELVDMQLVEAWLQWRARQ
jgi:CMP-N-acetylneuraminic acid synthetase